jgi:hypothetical protein
VSARGDGREDHAANDEREAARRRRRRLSRWQTAIDVDGPHGGLAEKIEATAEALVEDAEAMKATRASNASRTSRGTRRKARSVSTSPALARRYLDSPEGHDWEALHDFA